MLQWRRVPVPVRGINRSITEPEMDLRMGLCPWMQNLLPVDGVLEARRTDASTLITRNFMELFEFGDESGTLHLVGIGTDKKLYDIRRAANGDLSEVELGTMTGDSFNASMVTLGGSGLNRVYATVGHRTGTQTQTNIYNWNGTAFAQIPGTGFSRLDANLLLAYKGHLLGADIIERSESGSTDEHFPYRIRWASILDPTEFLSSRTNSAGHVDLVEDRNNSRILNMVPLREVVAVYKEDCIYNMTYKGVLQFVPQITATDRGALGPKAMAPVLDGNKHLVVSSDNIYLYNGFSFDAPAIGDPVRDWFFKELDWDRKEEVRVTTFPGRYEAWISFPTTDPDYPTRILVWNWKYNGWLPQSADYRSLYVSSLFFNEPTFLGTRSETGAGLFRIGKGTGTEEGTYSIPLHRIEESSFGEASKFMILQLTLDADGDWEAQVRATNTLEPDPHGEDYVVDIWDRTAVSMIRDPGRASIIRKDIGIPTIEFRRYDYHRYNGVKLIAPAVDNLETRGKDPARLREVNISVDITGRR